MSGYTVKGSAELDARIDKDLARIAEAASPYSAAGILLGGYGRGEGTPFIHPDGSQAPFNDYDLVAIVEKLDAPVRQKFKTLEQQLSSELDIPVDLYPYGKQALSSCEFSLLNYEMKYGHMVVWGDEHVLDVMPDYPHGAVPPSEGTRLLLNRGKLLLDIKLRLARSEALTDKERIRFLKFISKAWLALGDCALLAEGTYDISYSVKRERITSISDTPKPSTVIEEYLDAIDLKEWGDYSARLSNTNVADEFIRVRDTFLEFYDWYRKLYAGREGPFFKTMLLNLIWNRWPYLSHPRRRLYEALPELLKDHPDQIILGQILCCSRNVEERFYKLQARFS